MTQEPVTPLERHSGGCTCWPHVGEREATEAIIAAARAEYAETKKANAARAEAEAQVAAYRSLLVRIRENSHASHDDGSPIEACQRWVCFHVGVYLRHFGETAARDHDARIARPWREALSRPPIFQRAKCCSFVPASHYNADGLAEGEFVIQPPHEPVMDEDSGFVMVPYSEVRSLLNLPDPSHERGGEK